MRMYHHLVLTYESRSIQHYKIKFVSDLQHVGGFLWVLRFPPPIKTDRHNVTEILLKVVLNTLTLTPREEQNPDITSEVYNHIFHARSDRC
jgi:hypothetical protein